MCSVVLLDGALTLSIIPYLQCHLRIMPAQINPDMLCRSMAMRVGEGFLQGILERFSLLITGTLWCSLFPKQAVNTCALAEAVSDHLQSLTQVAIDPGGCSRFTQQTYDATTLGDALAQ